MFPTQEERINRFFASLKPLSLVERNLFTGKLLEKLDAIPLSRIISTDGSGEILINGQALNIDSAKVLFDAANSALDNRALKIAWEHTRWLAFKEGLASGRPPEELIFFRSALWFSEQLKEQLQFLAQRDQQPPL